MKIPLKLAATGMLAASLAAGISQEADTAALPDLTVELGAEITGTGLRVPSGGDGVHVAEVIDGVAARRIEGEGSRYLYVRLTDPAYGKDPLDLYVTIEAFDDSVGEVELQYMREAPATRGSFEFVKAKEALLLIDSQRWRRGVFHLPAARLGQGKNLKADFRLVADQLAVRRIIVSPRKPADYDSAQALDAEALRSIRVERPPGMELTFGSDATPAEAAVLAALGTTSIESYVHWAEVEPKENQWDWSKWDQQVAILKQAKLQWVPFLICGTAYGTPLWFQDGPDSHNFRCLEHDEDSRVQSLFNPALRPRIERFIEAFAERYRDSGVIESVLLGVSGIFGESLYPAGPTGGWTARLTGEYHNHHGWWAADRHAVAAFRRAMAAKYADIDALNQAWASGYAAFDEVSPFLPERAPNQRARADFAEWYQQAMTDWSVFWAKTTRRFFPETEIYLCTGGNGTPSLGADFTAQTKAMAELGVGIRITNEASDYAANFNLTREVATATRLYGSFCGFEPAGKVDERGVVARIYNASASGARQIHYYKPNVLGTKEAFTNFRAAIKHLKPREPQIDAALYLSRESWAIDPTAIGRLSRLALPLRDLTDMDYVTRLSLEDGALKGKRVLILAESPVLDPAAAAAISRFVRDDGGILIAITRPGETIGQQLDDQDLWRKNLLAEQGAALGSAPDRARLKTLTRQVGQGWTISLPGLAAKPDELAKLLAELLHNTPTYLPDVRSLAPDDGRLNDIFTTTFEDGVLRYDAEAATIK